MKLWALIAIPAIAWGHANHANHHASKEPLASKRNVNAERELVYQRIDREFQERIKPIFEAKCIDCHSGQTSYPWYHSIPIVRGMIDTDIREGRKHLELESGFPFQGHGTPEEDLEAVRQVSEAGSMPPRKYLWLHPSKSLTDAERSEIKAWASSSLKELAHLKP